MNVRRAVFFASVLALAGCQCAVLEPGARFLCQSDADCPGSRCAPDGFCVAVVPPDGGGGGPGGALPGCGGGWCWDNPRPFGRVRLNAVHAVSPTEVWISGELGTLFHWDGQQWSQQVSGTEVSLNGVWQSTAGDVWAVGASGAIRHLEGGRFVEAKSGAAAGLSSDLFAIDGPPAGPPIIAGAQSRILRLTGSGWADATAPGTATFSGLAATVAGAEVATGTACRAWNGSTFAACQFPVAGQWPAVWQEPSGQTWLGGGAGALYRAPSALDGGWVRVDAGTGSTIRALWGDGAGEVYLAANNGLYALNGGGPFGTQTFMDVHGSGPSDVWAVALGGDILRGSAGGFADGKKRTGLTGLESMTGVAVSTSGHALITGDRHVVYLRELDGGWATLPAPSGQNYAWYRAAWVDGAMQGFVVGDAPIRLARYDHVSRAVFPLGSVSVPADLTAVWGADAANVWAVGDVGTVMRLESGSWSQVTIPNLSEDLSGVWGSAAGDVYVVSDVGHVAHLQGGTWSVEQLSGSPEIFDVEGLSASEVFLATVDGVLRRDPGSGQWLPDGLGGTAVIALASASGTLMALTGSGETWLRSGGVWSRREVPWAPNGAASEGLSCVGGADGVGFFLGSVGSAIFRYGL